MCNAGHAISELAKNNPDPLAPSSTAKQSAIVELLKHPQEMRVDKVLVQDKATPIDVANVGPYGASQRAVRNTGRVAGLVIGAVAGGEAAGGLGAGGETAVPAAAGETATSARTPPTGGVAP